MPWLESIISRIFKCYQRLNYKCYYNEFNMDNFKAELDEKLKSGIVIEYSNFQNIFVQVLNNMLQQRKKLYSSIIILS